MDHGQYFTFCCFGHSDLNSHFKNLNTSNTSLKLGEPHEPKHTLSTLSSKQIPWVFREFQVISLCLFWTVSLIPMKNPDVWNFHSSPTMNNGKLIWYVRSPLYATVSYMAHFLIPFGMREKNGVFWTEFHSYWHKI